MGVKRLPKALTSARAALEELGLELGRDVDPVRELAEIALLLETPIKIKVDCWKTIAQYVYPKLQASTLSLVREPEQIPEASFDRIAASPTALDATQTLVFELMGVEQGPVVSAETRTEEAGEPDTVPENEPLRGSGEPPQDDGDG